MQAFLRNVGTCRSDVKGEVQVEDPQGCSWEDAAKVAIATASQTLEDLRIAEVVKQDVTIEKGKVTGFRVRLNISFKYHPSKG